MINSGTINGVTINAPSVDPYLNYLSSFSTTDTITFKEGLSFIDYQNYVDVLTINLSMVFKEDVNNYDDLLISGTFLYNLSENLSHHDGFSIGLLYNLAEAIGVADTAELTVEKVLAITEAITLSTALTTNYNALVSFTEAILAADSSSFGFAADFAEAYGITDDLTFSETLAILESIVMADTNTSTMRLFMSVSEDSAISDDLSINAIFSLDILENVAIGGVIHLPDGVYEAWVVNAETRSAWQYDNYNFNSFANLGGQDYGLNEDGLYTLDGDTDDGQNIDSVFKTGMLNLGSTLFKHMPRAYIGYSTDGCLRLNTITTESGKKIERWYDLPKKSADDITNARIKLARGVKSVYWQFEVENIEGADFDIDEFKVLPVILRRRR